MRKMILATIIIIVFLSSNMAVLGISDGRLTHGVTKLNNDLVNAYTISMHVTENSNKTVAPIVKVFLKNGSIINYTTLDLAIKRFYYAIAQKELTLNDILNVSVLLFEDYLQLSNNSVKNITKYLPGYSAFFTKLSNLKKYNYSGKIIPVNGRDFLYSTYGDKITKCFLYGRLSNLRIIDVTGNKVTFQKNDILILSYVNASDSTLLGRILDSLNRTAFSSNNVKVIVIDISNGLNESMSIVQDYKKLYFANDANTSIAEGINGSFSSFGFVVTPAYVYISDDLFVYRKTMGYEDVGIINQYIEAVSKGDMGVFSYIISDLSAINLKAGERAFVYVRLNDGFGNVTVTLRYDIVDINNETLNSGTINKEVRESGWLDFEVDLLNESRLLILDLSIYRKGELENHLTTFFEVSEIEQIKRGSEFPWGLVISLLVVLLLVITMGSYAYRYVTKERYVTRKRKRRRAKK